jgi:hypothetical protein
MVKKMIPANRTTPQTASETFFHVFIGPRYCPVEPEAEIKALRGGLSKAGDRCIAGACTVIRSQCSESSQKTGSQA